jgi:hypothetical protein
MECNIPPCAMLRCVIFLDTLGPSNGQKLKTQPNVLQTGPRQFNVVGRSVSLENPAPNTRIVLKYTLSDSTSDRWSPF